MDFPDDFPWDELMQLDDHAKRYIARLAAAFRYGVVTLEELKAQLDDQGRPTIGTQDWLESRMPDWAVDSFRDVDTL